MNERYLFRGKRVDNGEWVEGYYVPVYLSSIRDEFRPDYYKGKNFIAVERKGESYSSYATEVDPDTAGQCTGLRDKDGILIFEGDILKFPEPYMENIHTVEFGYYPGEYEYDTPNYGYYIEEIATAHKSTVYFLEDERIVRGNIHDNPELLKG